MLNVRDGQVSNHCVLRTGSKSVTYDFPVVVFGCGPVAGPARSWVQPVASDRVVVHCNDSETSWTLVCDGDVWRSAAAAGAASNAAAAANCSATAALTGDTGPFSVPT